MYTRCGFWDGGELPKCSQLCVFVGVIRINDVYKYTLRSKSLEQPVKVAGPPCAFGKDITYAHAMYT